MILARVTFDIQTNIYGYGKKTKTYLYRLRYGMKNILRPGSLVIVEGETNTGRQIYKTVKVINLEKRKSRKKRMVERILRRQQPYKLKKIHSIYSI
jgi:hypothetical protein